MSSPARSVLGPRVRGELFVLLFRQPERAVQFFVALPSLQQAFGLEPFEVGQVAQGGEAERLQECLRGDIGERGAGLRGADGADPVVGAGKRKGRGGSPVRCRRLLQSMHAVFFWQTRVVGLMNLAGDGLVKD
jgi:hypothetical protein